MSTLRIIDCEQRTPEWFAARCGLVTASVISKLVTSRGVGAADVGCPGCYAAPGSPCVSKRGAAPQPIQTMHPERSARAAQDAATSPRIIEPASGDEVRNLAATIVAERLTGHVESGPITGDMWRGIEEEPRARDRYAETRKVKVREVGLLVRDFDGFSIGYSPDALVDEDGLLEVKAPRAKGHVLTVLDGKAPTYNVAQVQTGLLVSGRAWLDFLPWHGGLPMWTTRVYPDPAWQTAILAAVAGLEKTVAEMTAKYLKATEGAPTTERAPDFNNVELKL